MKKQEAMHQEKPEDKKLNMEELSDDELDNVAGGFKAIHPPANGKAKCPYCGQMVDCIRTELSWGSVHYICLRCNKPWNSNK
ncbi:MAG TPA: hypothetical protein H9761_09370 [Candidatus Eisenbergiella merdavium]|uniref:Uncharacterized protein n=1 Tax=Candidatus Eisenbergiella merdavium TaxID=2838551 RepID=A0A9D2NGP6_9FIRM|nr:hypothetical protein [Candidatus Eisenbergiella merdavium]